MKRFQGRMTRVRVRKAAEHGRRIVCTFLVGLLCANFSLAEETAFRGVKLADAKGKQADASLIFSDNNKNVVVRAADRDVVTIPYDQIDKFSYEYTKKHRITQGAIVMVASLGAGAIVMLTKSKSHWLYIDFHEQSNSKSVVLRMDKNEYKKSSRLSRPTRASKLNSSGKPISQRKKRTNNKASAFELRADKQSGRSAAHESST